MSYFPHYITDSSGNPIGATRGIDGSYNLDVQVEGLTDQYGFTGQFNPVHSLQVAQPYRLVGTVLYSCDSGNTNVPPTTVDFKDIPFFIGLTVVTVGATAKTTVVYE